MEKLRSMDQGRLWNSAWPAIKTKTQENESTLDVNYVEPSQKDVDNLLFTVSFSSDKETKQQICNPDPETAFHVMVKRRRAEVKVSTLSPE